MLYICFAVVFKPLLQITSFGYLHGGKALDVETQRLSIFLVYSKYVSCFCDISVKFFDYLNIHRRSHTDAYWHITTVDIKSIFGR